MNSLVSLVVLSGYFLVGRRVGLDVVRPRTVIQGKVTAKTQRT